MFPNVGSFGTVYLCRKTTSGERKAVKLFFCGDEKVWICLYVTQVGVARAVKGGRHQGRDDEGAKLPLYYKVLMHIFYVRGWKKTGKGMSGEEEG
jgi:hypothetical protein